MKSKESCACVLWLPAHPAMGWISMNRYWNALTHLAEKPGAEGFRISAPFKNIPTESAPSNRWCRAWARHVAYPMNVAMRRGIDIVHVLDHSFAGLLRWTDRRAVTFVTVHDLAPLEVPEALTPAQVARFRRQCEYLRIADWLLCDSDHTRSVLASRLGLFGERVVTLPLGVDIPPQPLEGDANSSFFPSALPSPYLLVVGGVSPRKNLKVLPGLLQGIKACGIPMTIVKVGHPLPLALAQELRDVGGASSLVEMGRIDQRHLSALYRKAVFTFVPSTYEGFGLPVLEAMAHGCPVICSNATSLPEVGGTAALYFAPHDVAAAVQQAVALLSDSALRSRMIEQGRARAAELRWSAHWERLLALYSQGLEARFR